MGRASAFPAFRLARAIIEGEASMPSGRRGEDGQKGRQIVHQHFHRVLAEHISDEVRHALQHADGRAAIPAELATECIIVTTFILVLKCRRGPSLGA